MLSDTGRSFKVTALSARPQNFSDVVGQKHITLTLRHAIARGQVAHALLFSGPRGVGKTSTARIFAKALNCAAPAEGEPCNQCESCRQIIRGNDIDVVEIDAASHNGVDHIRDLREQVRFPPSVSRFKVYVIDEVHMLSMGAFNALLKTLEEPPGYVRFVMATTELHKVPATILSRCQKYRFRPIPLAEMVDNLQRVIGPEGMARLAADEAEQVLYYVARSAQGSLRDAQSTLDQVLALSTDKVRYRDVEELLGMVELDALAALFDCVAERKPRELLELLDRLLGEGKDAQQLVRDLENYVRNLLVARHHPEPGRLLELPADLAGRVVAQAKLFEVGSLLKISELFWDLEARMRWSSESRVMLEVALLKAMRLAESAGLDRLLDRLAELEARLGGAPASAPPSPQREAPARQAASAPTPPADDAALLSEMRAQWADFAAGLPSSRTTACLADTAPLRLEGQTLVLEVPKGFEFHMASLGSPEGRRALEEALRSRWGRSLALRLEFSEQARSHADPPSAPAGEEGGLDPGVKQTLELFSGKIVKKSRKKVE